MSQDQFEKTEAEYFRLRGQLAAKRISQGQFEAALRQLVFQDAQGRSWMLGVDSGKWYVHDGKRWVEAQPPMSGSDASVPHAAFTATNQLPRARKFPWRVVGFCFFILLVCILGLIGSLALGLLRINVAPSPRTIPQPGIVYVFPSPTFGFLISATSTLPVVLVQMPTATTSATLMATATATDTPIPLIPSPTISPGVYVTSLRLEPPSPKRREDVGFYPTFLNTTSSEQGYRWLVYIYRSDNMKHSFGETPKSTPPFPIGAVELRASGTWKLTGGGDCENFIARVAWINQDNQPIPFTKPDGQVYELAFAVCP